MSRTETTYLVVATRYRTYSLNMLISVDPNAEYEITFDSKSKQVSFVPVLAPNQIDINPNLQLEDGPQPTDFQNL